MKHMKHSFKVRNDLGCLQSPLLFSIVLDAVASSTWPREWKNKRPLSQGSLVVQYLGLCASTAEDRGSVLGWGLKVPHTV